MKIAGVHAAMIKRLSIWLPIALAVLSIGFAVGAVVFRMLNRAGPGPDVTPVSDDVAMAALFPLVGLLITLYRPGNRIGWICVLIGCSGALAVFSPEYAVYTLFTQPGAFPSGALLSWLSVWVWSIGWVGIVLLMLLFPTGRLLSRRWAWPGIVETIAVGSWIIILGGLSWQFRGPALLAPESAPEVRQIDILIEQVAPVLFLTMVLALLAAVIAAIVRFRRSRGVERQQMKWFVLAVACTALGAVSGFVFSNVVPVSGWLAQIIYSLEVLAFSSGPIAIGIAILRYRLFDIDVIVRRTLVYTTLTVALALVYFVSVILLQRLFRALSGQESDLAVVASTLGLAALFNPLRGRIQAAIDRRFYRGKYDAEHTLLAFSAWLRDETNLDQLTREMLAVVEETMQPAHVSLWLKSTDGDVRRVVTHYSRQSSARTP
jgi:hypothetical protein